MSWKTVITDAGRALIAAAPGHVFAITRAACGAGKVDEDELSILGDLKDYIMDLPIVDQRTLGQTATLRLRLDNREAGLAFDLCQIGVYARLLDGESGEAVSEETLLLLLQGEQPDRISPDLQVSEYLVSTVVADGSYITVQTDHAAYVSQGMLHDLREELEAQIQQILEELGPLRERVARHGEEIEELKAGGRVEAHNLDPEAHPDLQGRLSMWDARLSRLEDMVLYDITGNAFAVGFGDLAEVNVTGVWNKTQKRIEF